jgi:uncharacterized protein
MMADWAAMKPINLLLTAILSLAALAANAGESTRPLRALLVTGGCCHDYETQKRIIPEGISARANVQWTVVHEGGSSRDHKVSIYSNADWARGYDVIVHNECFGALTDDAFIEGIAAPHYAGVPAVMLHCSVHSYRAAKTDAWRECLGVSSYRHEKRRDLRIENLLPEHPVMKGFPELWLNPDDELYEVAKIWPGVVPLARAYGEDTKKHHVCVWVNTYGQGRVFATSLGHQNATMQNPVFLDLITRGLLWACDKLDENGKPKPGYEAARRD